MHIYIYIYSYKYNIYICFIFSPISPHCVHLSRMPRTMGLKKMSPNSNPAEKAMALLGLLDTVILMVLPLLSIFRKES